MKHLAILAYIISCDVKLPFHQNSFCRRLPSLVRNYFYLLSQPLLSSETFVNIPPEFSFIVWHLSMTLLSSSYCANHLCLIRSTSGGEIWWKFPKFLSIGNYYGNQPLRENALLWLLAWPFTPSFWHPWWVMVLVQEWVRWIREYTYCYPTVGFQWRFPWDHDRISRNHACVKHLGRRAGGWNKNITKYWGHSFLGY